MNTGKNLWLVSHDAGGAEMVACWFLNYKGPKFKNVSLIAEGPAVSVFKRRLPELLSETRNHFSPSSQDNVVTGSGWASDLEREAIQKGKSAGSFVVTILDHWVNYRERFMGLPEGVEPDEIWLGDLEAFKIAQKVFSVAPKISSKLVQIENPYFIETLKEMKSAASKTIEPNEKSLRVLYLCEAVSEHESKMGGSQQVDFPEFRAARRFIDWLRSNEIKGKTPHLRMRLHPSEKRDKYNFFISQASDIEITLSEGTTLVEDCAWADWVAGMNSMALVVALMAGKRVVSCMPSPSDPCMLPQSEIEKI